MKTKQQILIDFHDLIENIDETLTSIPVNELDDFGDDLYDKIDNLKKLI